MPDNRYTFAREKRIGGFNAFRPVYAARVKEYRGPLTMYAKPNDLSHPRLGISIGRRVGIAVKRNRIKRLLRESFRLMQHDLPRGYDFVVVVAAHDPLILADYQKLLSALATRLHRTWEKKTSAGSSSNS